MRYTKDIFDILSRGGFISQNSVSQQLSNLYDAIEDDFQQYQDYFSGIGFLLEGGNGYYYFSRSENKVELADKVQRMAEWIDRIDFLKTFNTAFGSGFTFRKSNILEQFSSDIELKEKARHLYTDLKTNDEKMDKLISDLQRQGFRYEIGVPLPCRCHDEGSSRPSRPPAFPPLPDEGCRPGGCH